MQKIAQKKVLWTSTFFLLSSLFFPFIYAQAQENTQQETKPKKQTVKRVKEVEVVASPLEQSTEDSISLNDIRRSGAVDPGEAIADMTGVEIIRRASIAHPIILRGQTRDAVSATIDGQNLFGACPGHMDPITFHADFAQVEKINLIRGPYNVTTPGAEAGSVNIKTANPEVKPSVKAGVTYGMNNYVNAYLQASGGFKWIQVLAGYSYRESQIYKDGNGNLATSYTSGTSAFKSDLKTAKTKAFGIHSAWGKLQIAPAEGHRLLFSGSYQNANGYNGVLYYDRGMDAIVDDTGRFSARWEADKMGKLKDIYAEIYWGKVRHTMDTSNRTGSLGAMGVVTAEGFSETVGSKLGTTIELDTADIALGWDFYLRRWDISHSSTMFPVMIPDSHTYNSGLFLEYKQAIGEKTGITVAGRADFALVKAKKDNLAKRKQEWADSVDKRNFYLFGGNVQVNHYVIEELNLFLGLGHSARLPDAKELLVVHPMRIRGNSNLKAEHKTEVDIGFEADSKWVVSRLNLFYAYVDNYIAQGKTQNLLPGMGGMKTGTTYYNTNAHMGGFEFDLNILLPAGFSLPNQIAMTVGRKEKTATLSSNGIELPPLTGMSGIRWDWTKQGLYIQTDVKYAAAQKNLDGDLLEKSTAAWATWNFSMGIERKYYAVRLNVDNMLNTFYYTHNSSPMKNATNPSVVRVPEPGVGFRISVEGKYN